MTNYERIKQMSIEEMAYTIMCPYETDPDICNEYDCIKCTKEWLEMEVDERERLYSEEKARVVNGGIMVIGYSLALAICAYVKTAMILKKTNTELSPKP